MIEKKETTSNLDPLGLDHHSASDAIADRIEEAEKKDSTDNTWEIFKAAGLDVEAGREAFSKMAHLFADSPTKARFVAGLVRQFHLSTELAMAISSTITFALKRNDPLEFIKFLVRAQIFPLRDEEKGEEQP